MFDWQALSNFFIAISIGIFLATISQFVSLDLVIQVNPKSEDMAAALFFVTWVAQLAVIALMLTQLELVHSSSPIYAAFSLWVFVISLYFAIQLSQTILRWLGYV